jgi:hypothetical protein
MRHFLLLAVLAVPSSAFAADGDTGRAWQPGDHHVHSEWSVDWDRTTSPPTPIRGGDSPYTRSDNARQAQKYGLTWMVHTDHGGPGHSAVTRDHAWPALEQARRDVPALVQFNGAEFDVPAAEHASLIIAPTPRERDELVEIEHRFGRSEPVDGVQRDDGQTMLDALAHMRALPAPPVMFVNHPRVPPRASAPGAMWNLPSCAPGTTPRRAYWSAWKAPPATRPSAANVACIATPRHPPLAASTR